MKRPLLSLPPVDRTSRKPLHIQIAAAIGDAIRSGSLAPGSLLLSTRDLAREAGVSRKTALAAYETLARQALIAAARGSATRVAGRLPVIQAVDGAWRSAIRESRYPQRVGVFTDPDGNLLYLSSR